MEGSAFLRERATPATAHKDTLGRTVRLVGHAHTYTTHTNMHSDIMKSAPCLSVFNKVRLSNSPFEGSKVKLSITVGDKANGRQRSKVKFTLSGLAHGYSPSRSN